MLLRLQNSFVSMTEQVRQQEQTATNLANANTVGYKRDRMFTEVLNEFLDAEAAPQSERASAQWADLAAGPLEETGSPLDVALGGDGFFVVTDDATGAERYTRAGRFTLDSDGVVRTPAGLAVEGDAGPLKIPAGSEVEVLRSGEVRADGQPVGRLRVVNFANPLALQRVDGAAFLAPGQAPEEVDAPVVLQGVVEGSNADPVREMTQMITNHRLFESQQKLLQSQDNVLGQVTRDLGKF